MNKRRKEVKKVSLLLSTILLAVLANRSDIPTAQPNTASAISEWRIETVDTTAGHDLSLQLDSFDRPHISYCTPPGGAVRDLRYARWTGSDWEIQTVDDAYNYYVNQFQGEPA